MLEEFGNITVPNKAFLTVVVIGHGFTHIMFAKENVVEQLKRNILMDPASNCGNHYFHESSFYWIENLVSSIQLLLMGKLFLSIQLLFKYKNVFINPTSIYGTFFHQSSFHFKVTISNNVATKNTVLPLFIPLRRQYLIHSIKTAKSDKTFAISIMPDAELR